MLAFFSLVEADKEDSVSLKAGSAETGERSREVETMPYRMFEDSRGMEWQVWDIVPRLVERRTGEGDRRADIAVIEFADRRRDDRRLATTRRPSLRGSYAHGWLAFDNGREKRRLTPIPKDWTTCSAERLEEYARQAESVPGSRRSPFAHYEDDEPFAEAG